MKTECEVVTSDWDGIIPALNAKFDFIVASMSITDERKQAVDFTDPYYTNKLQFVAPKSVDFKTDKDSLKGKVIGAQRATIAGTWLEDNMADVVTIKLYDTQENAYLDLSSGRLDGVLADKFVQYDWLKSDAGKEFEFKGEPVFDNDKIGIAVRKGDPLREAQRRAEGNRRRRYLQEDQRQVLPLQHLLMPSQATAGRVPAVAAFRPDFS